MANLQSAGYTLAVGLNWAHVDARREVRTRLRDAARQKKALRYVVTQTEAEELQLGLETDAPKGSARVYAGGLLIAQLLRDAIVFETVAPGRVWVCAVRDGVPLPGTDKLTTPEDAEQVMEEVRSYAPAPIKLVGNHPEAGMTLAALMEDAEPAMLRTARMQRPTDTARVVFYAVLFAAVGISGWWLLNMAPKPETVIAQAAPQFFGPTDDEIRAGDAKLLAQGREAMLYRPDAAVVTSAWRETIRTIPYGVGGYRPSQADCQRDACHLQWDWRSDQFEQYHVARLPGEVQPSKTPGEYMRRVQTRMGLEVESTRRLDGIARADLDDWAMDLITRVRRTGARIDIAAPTQAITVKLPPLRDKKPRSQPVGHEGRISVIASGWAAIQALFGLLGQEQVVVERSVYNLTGSSISMQLEARYVVLAD